MQTDEYYIEKNEAGRDTIRQQDSDLAITIFHLELEPFHTRKDKLQMFADDHGELIAFQTGLIDLYDEVELISRALEWYAIYLDYPEMRFTNKDPRPAGSANL